MHWEAFIVIGVFTLGLGVLLFVPAWIWAKRQRRTEPEKHPKIKLTKLGWALIGATIIILIGGLLMDYIAPESPLGRFIRLPGGRFFYFAIVASLFWVLELALKAKGIKLTTDDKHVDAKKSGSERISR